MAYLAGHDTLAAIGEHPATAWKLFAGTYWPALIPNRKVSL